MNGAMSTKDEVGMNFLLSYKLDCDKNPMDYFLERVEDAEVLIKEVFSMIETVFIKDISTNEIIYFSDMKKLNRSLYGKIYVPTALVAD